MRVVLLFAVVVFGFVSHVLALQTTPSGSTPLATCPSGGQVEEALNRVLNSNNKLLRRSLNFPNYVKGGYVGKFDFEPSPEKNGYDCIYFRKGDHTNPIVKFSIPPRH